MMVDMLSLVACYPIDLIFLQHLQQCLFGKAVFDVLNEIIFAIGAGDKSSIHVCAVIKHHRVAFYRAYLKKIILDSIGAIVPHGINISGARAKYEGPFFLLGIVIGHRDPGDERANEDETRVQIKWFARLPFVLILE